MDYYCQFYGGTSLSFDQGKSPVVNLNTLNQLWYHGNLVMGEEARLIFNSQWNNMEIHDHLTIEDHAKVTFGDYGLFYINSCGGDVCTVGSSSNLTISRGAKFYIYKKFIMGSRCSMLLGENSKFVLQDGVFSQSDGSILSPQSSSQLLIAGEFYQSDSAAVSIGKSSILALSGSTYLEKGSKLTTSTQSYVETAAGSKLTLTQM